MQTQSHFIAPERYLQFNVKIRGVEFTYNELVDLVRELSLRFGHSNAWGAGTPASQPKFMQVKTLLKDVEYSEEEITQLYLELKQAIETLTASRQSRF